MPREAPVTTATFPVRSNMVALRDASKRRNGRSRGSAGSSIVRERRVRSNLPAEAGQAPCQDPLQHTCGRPRMQAAARRPPSAPATTPGAPAPRSPPPRRASARRRRWRRPARAGRDAVSARSSGARRSSAGFISAQWNGALTGSGMTRLAPSAFARSPARATAAVAPAITTWPGAFRFAGLTTSPSAASAQACATFAASRPRMAAIAPCPTGTASCM